MFRVARTTAGPGGAAGPAGPAVWTAARVSWAAPARGAELAVSLGVDGARRERRAPVPRRVVAGRRRGRAGRSRRVGPAGRDAAPRFDARALASAARRRARPGRPRPLDGRANSGL